MTHYDPSFYSFNVFVDNDAWWWAMAHSWCIFEVTLWIVELSDPLGDSGLRWSRVLGKHFIELVANFIGIWVLCGWKTWSLVDAQYWTFLKNEQHMSLKTFFFLTKEMNHWDPNYCILIMCPLYNDRKQMFQRCISRSVARTLRMTYIVHTVNKKMLRSA